MMHSSLAAHAVRALPLPPMNQHPILDQYERIKDVTGQMVAAAKRADWDHLIDLEESCRSLTHALMEAERGVQLPPPVLERKVALIRTVLADDAEIRNLTEPWMRRLQELLQGVDLSHQVKSAYGRSNEGNP
ncbi:MAG: flagellar protein FliT [Betaproteobacteria bacterium]|nr:flagellar protein FliT [Betaproteobacteria bacterium]